MATIQTSEGTRPRIGVVLLGLVLSWAAFIRAEPMAVPAATPGSAAASATNLKLLSLEELTTIQVETVYGASKHEQKVVEAPSAVTIITRDDILKYGYRSLGEALNSAPGLYVRNDRNFSLMGIRGFGLPGNFNTKFQVLLDGHRMNNGVTGAGWIDQGFGVDVDLIERVEVIRGPGSSLYGDSAFFGVINVITRRGKDIGGGEVSASAGGRDTYSGRFSYGNQFSNGVEVAVSGSYRHSLGNLRLYYPEFDAPATHNGVAEYADGSESASVFTAISWRGLTLEGGYVERTKNIPTASFGTVFNDPRNQTVDAQTFVDLKFEHTFENELNLLARLGYDRGTEDGTYIYDYGLPALVANIDGFLGQRLTGDVQLSRTFFQRHAVTVGAQIVGNLDQDQKNYDVSPPMVYLADERQGVNYAFYLQDEYKICQQLILNAGVRYDHFDTFGKTVNPRLALIYQPVAGTALKFLYGTAFRAPSPNELYYSDGGLSQVTSPQLRPETISSYELILDQQLGSHVSAAVSGYYYRVNDLIKEATLPPGDPFAGAIHLVNLGTAEAHGVELALKGNWARGFKSQVSYSWTEARDALTGARLVNSPEHLVKLGVIAPLYRDKIFGSVEWHYTSGRQTLAGQTAPGFGTANLTLFSRDLIRGVELSASVYNLFDTRYREPGGPEHVQDQIPQDGRSWRLKLTYRF